MKRKTPLMVLMLLLFSSIVSAITIDLNLPTQMILGQSMTINATVNEVPFNGSLIMSYTNIDASISSVNLLESNFVNNKYSITWQVTPKNEGVFSVLIEARNANNQLLTTRSISGTASKALPRINSTSAQVSPDSITVGMNAITDTDCTCRYGTSNASYDSLGSQFESSGGKNHSQTLTDLSGGTHYYYIACKQASSGLVSEASLISFTIDTVPTAKIRLADPNPVKEGINEVQLIASKSLPNAPTLEYSYNDKPNERFQVSLTGSGSDWKGYLVVTPEDDNKVGTFYFKGVDALGSVGTRITNNNLFVVDTTKPQAPQSIKAVVLADSSIKINWYYDGEDIDYFNVYRASASGVNYVDFYAKANKTQAFADKFTVNQVTYFYRVAAVDLAGNEGPLSQEVFATAINKFSQPASSQNQDAIEEAPKVLPPNLIPKVDAKIKEMDKYLIDVKDALGDLATKSAEEQQLIARFQIETKLRNAETSLDSAIAQLESFKESFATELELDQKLKDVDLDVQKLRKTTPQAAYYKEKVEFNQAIAKEDIKIAAQENLEGLGLSDADIDEYVKVNTKERDMFKVSGRAHIVEVQYIDGSSREETTITKLVTYDDARALEDVVLVEIIPKKVSASAKEISGSNRNFEVLNEDPILKFGFLTFNYQGEEISYNLDRRADLEEVKKTKTVALVSAAALEEASKATGFSVFPITQLGLSKMQSLFVWIGLLSIFGLLGYYLVFVRQISVNPLSVASKAKNYFENKKLSNKFKSRISGKSYYEPRELRKEESGYIHYPHLEPIHEQTQGILQLLEEAHLLLASGQTAQASIVYAQISQLYQNLPKEQKTQFYSECVNLHRKLHAKDREK